jgi:hypothetical protein
MATILELNKKINIITSGITQVSMTNFILSTSDIENYLVENTYYKVFYHLNPSTFNKNNENGTMDTYLNYRLIVVDLLTDNNSNFESSINDTQLIIEEIVYKLSIDKDILITDGSYTLQPFINEFSVKLCGWYVDIPFYKDINISC